MNSKTSRYSRRSLALALAVVGVAGLGTASAAQVIVNQNDAVAGVDVVVNCDADGVVVNYTLAYQTLTPGPGYVVTSVTISDLNDPGNVCTGMVRVTLTDASNNALATGAVALPASPTTAVAVPLSTAVAVPSIFAVAVAIG